MSKAKINVTRAYEFDNGNISINLEVNGVTIYGASIVNGRNGKFVSFPSYKKDGRYWNYAYFPFDEDELEDVLDQVGDMLAGKTNKRSARR
jgi:DNA-binding cell septation regulator SpoVG